MFLLLLLLPKESNKGCGFRQEVGYRKNLGEIDGEKTISEYTEQEKIYLQQKKNRKIESMWRMVRRCNNLSTHNDVIMSEFNTIPI